MRTLRTAEVPEFQAVQKPRRGHKEPLRERSSGPGQSAGFLPCRRRWPWKHAAIRKVMSREGSFLQRQVARHGHDCFLMVLFAFDPLVQPRDVGVPPVPDYPPTGHFYKFSLRAV